MLRVLYVDHTGAAGGAELALRRMLDADLPWRATLALPTGIDAGVFGERVGVRLGPPQNATGATSGVRRGRFRAAFYILAGMLRFACSPKVRSFDIVHANTLRAAVLCCLVPMFRGPKLVLHVRDRLSPSEVGWVPAWTALLIIRSAASAIITNSNETLKVLPRWAVHRIPAEVVYSDPGVPMAYSSSSSTENSSVRLVHVARLAEWKGQHLVVDAVAALRSRGHPVECVFAGAALFGDASYESSVRRRVADLGVGDYIQFLGHVDDVAAVIDSADVCIHASTKPEPLGQNLMQYMLRGKAIVAAEGGGASELLADQQSALLFEAGSADDLADKIERLSSDPRLRNAIAQNALRESSRFDQAESLGRMARLYDSIRGVTK